MCVLYEFKLILIITVTSSTASDVNALRNWWLLGPTASSAKQQLPLKGGSISPVSSSASFASSSLYDQWHRPPAAAVPAALSPVLAMSCKVES